jgi:hypothetical protein
MGGDHLWDAVGAIGQMLGSLAVFITLIYLAIQARHTRREVQRSASRYRWEAARELYLGRVNNERLTSLNVRAQGGLQDGARNLNPFSNALTERLGMTYEDGMSLNWEQMAWWQYRVGVITYVDELPKAEREAFDASTSAAYRLPLGRLWYEVTKATLNADTVRYIDNLLAQPV